MRNKSRLRKLEVKHEGEEMVLIRPVFHPSLYGKDGPDRKAPTETPLIKMTKAEYDRRRR